MQIEKLYSEFSEFLEENYIKESPSWAGVKKKPKLSTLKKTFIFHKITFLEFCKVLRDLYYDHDFNFQKNTILDLWLSKIFVKFLLQKDLIFIKENKVFFKENFSHLLVATKTENEILEKLKKSLKINTSLTFIENLRKEGFEWKEKYNQLPVSFNSSIFIASKIFDYFPIKGKFLFVGDDDFNSILLSFLEPELQITVVDIDKQVLEIIEEIKREYSLKNISTINCDIRNCKLKEKEFLGFVANPPYTYSGVKSFFNFGADAIKEGFGFLIIGNESIGNRFLLLQKFFSSRNFIIKEITNGKISYNFREIYKDDVKDKKQLESFGIKQKSYLVASLYVLEKIPWKIKEGREMGMYSYL